MSLVNVKVVIGNTHKFDLDCDTDEDFALAIRLIEQAKSLTTNMRFNAQEELRERIEALSEQPEARK